MHAMQNAVHYEKGEGVDERRAVESRWSMPSSPAESHYMIFALLLSSWVNNIRCLCHAMAQTVSTPNLDKSETANTQPRPLVVIASWLSILLNTLGATRHRDNHSRFILSVAVVASSRRAFVGPGSFPLRLGASSFSVPTQV